MKKLTVLFVVSLLGQMGNAQETLYANESHLVILFFPSPIRQAVTGAEHFTFSYNQESGQHFGLLQAHNGSESNLLVLTQDGKAYVFGLEYRRQLPETFRFIDISESIGTETETMVMEKKPDSMPLPKPIKIPKIDSPKELWEKGAEYVLNRKTKTLKTKRKDGLVLRLKELFYHSDEVYIELEIHNRSVVDFELDVLEIYKVNGSKGRRSSHQKVPMAPIFKHNQPHIIRSGLRHAFVFVLPKFTLGNSEGFLVELHEKKGNRMLRLIWH